MKLAFSIAKRFLLSSKGQTALILIGIVIGVSVQIFIGSLITGLQSSLVDTTIGNSSQVTIEAAGTENYFDHDENLLTQLEQDERVSVVSESFNGSGFIVLDDEETYTVLMRGFEFEQANEIYDLENALIEGGMPEGKNEIVVGTNLAKNLELTLNDTVAFLTTNFNEEELEIVGIFDLGVANLNETWIVNQLNSAQSIFDEENQISTIEMQIEDVFDADLIADDIESSLSDDLVITNWKEQNEQLLSGLTGQSISSYMIQVFVLLAVLLGIASVLAISVVQKSKQLGILKAMGIKDRTASLIFLFQGFMLGVIGSLIGIGLGIGLSYAFSVFVKNPDGTSLVPFFLDTQFIVISFVIAVIATTVAAFIPAKNSSKLNPIEVIKNG